VLPNTPQKDREQRPDNRRKHVSQHISNTDRYSASPDQIMEMLQDPQYLTEKYQALGDISFDVVEQASSDTGLKITIQREAPAPDSLKKFGSTSKMTQTEVWTRDGDGYKCDMKIEANPVHINGKMTVVPVGEESDWTADLDIKAGVPLVGGKIEKAVAEQSMQSMGLEKQFNDQWLSSH
jgi:hypothetical protein